MLMIHQKNLHIYSTVTEGTYESDLLRVPMLGGVYMRQV